MAVKVARTTSKSDESFEANLERVDPQMRRQLRGLRGRLGPTGFLGIDDLVARRQQYEAVGQVAAQASPPADVTREDVLLRNGTTGEGLRLRIYRPPESPIGSAPGPAVLYLHGGGMIMGGIETDDVYAAALAAEAGLIVVAVEYRLSPEHPYPAALNDCVWALTALESEQVAVEIDGTRLAVYGVSGGGGLAAAVALYLRDHEGPTIELLVLAAPMLDDRVAARLNHVELGVWDAAHNAEAWGFVLGHPAGAQTVPQYAAAGRALDVSGLPPTYLDVGALDLFLQEDLEFIQRLALAAVPIELHVYPGAYHGFDQIAPGSASSRAARDNRVSVLRRILGPLNDLTDPDAPEVPRGNAHELLATVGNHDRFSRRPARGWIAPEQDLEGHRPAADDRDAN
ncbi:alpha/beta hydrolase [Cryobacterium sp. M15]|uniref:alpha/beta hydrolase n=1 Tax=Cryobacterium sp. M15 TaxID=2048291 RepID=UPI000CE505B6|nr:alpha/beta hydrolase [Cryobacterium sp. M15]